jgi:acetylornithine deacetylase
MLEEARAHLARLVGFDTTSRNTNLPLLRWAEAELARHGVTARLMERDGKANLHAIIGPPVAGGIALSAHVDCVPVEAQAWTSDPFTLRRDGGRLYGRGTTDMKGFVACMLAMVPEFVAAPLARPIHLCLTHDEETTFEGAERLMPELAHDAPPPAWCVVGEPTSMRPVIAHKGYASWDVTVTGLSGHSSRTDATANALMAAAEAVAWLAAEHRRFVAEGRRVEGFEPPHTTVHAGTFHSGTVLNIVPDRADFTFEVRTVPGDDAREVLARFQAMLEGEIMPRLHATHPGAGFEIRRRAFAPALGLPETHPLTLATQRLTGRNSAARVSYGTEAGYFEAAGIAAIVCGPGDIAQAHQPDEFIEESELESCLGFLRRLAERQCQ